MSNENQISDAAPEATSQADIRGVLIQVGGARLLLRNATIAEVLSYAPPAPIEGDSSGRAWAEWRCWRFGTRGRPGTAEPRRRGPVR